MYCVYSTLFSLADQAKTNSTTPVITFDQSWSWWRSQIIVMNEENESHLKSIVLRLEVLHTERSHIGTIGHLMQNTGLNETLKIANWGNTVRRMFSGKAVTRARRGNFLLDAALNILLSDVLQVPLLMSCSTISNDTDTSKEHSDSTSTINSASKIIIKAKQSSDKLFTDNGI